MTTEVARRNTAQELAAQVRGDTFRDQVAMALPEGMSPERFVRVMATALIENPSIADLDRGSIFSAGLKAAADGLVPDGREAAFVPFKDKAQYVPMIGGYRKIADEYGWALETRIVHALDNFHYEQGLEPKLVHVPVRPGAERGEAIAAYAVARHRSRPPMFEVMTADEIEKVRQTSKAKDIGPWVDWPERMWEKTVGRRLFAKLPLGERDDRIARVLEASVLDEPAAAAALYGSGAEEARQLSPAGNANGTEQDAPPAPAPSPPDDDPEPGDEDEDEDEEDLAALAGEQVIKNGKHKGKRINEVEASWIGWCMRQETHELCLAARTYAEKYLPKVYHEEMAKLEAKS